MSHNMNIRQNIPRNIHRNIHPNMDTIPQHIPLNILLETQPVYVNYEYPTDWLYRLYLRTHIVPCPEDFNRQLSQNPQDSQTVDPVYLALYWTKQEQFYSRFVEEEMDLEALTLMTQEDYAYFGIRPF